jgi:hypothetical protein
LKGAAVQTRSSSTIIASTVVAPVQRPSRLTGPVQTTLPFAPTNTTSIFFQRDAGVLASDVFYCWYVEQPYTFTKMNDSGTRRIFHNQEKVTKMGRVVAVLLAFADVGLVIDPPTDVLGSGPYRAWIQGIKRLGCDMADKLQSYVKKKNGRKEAKLLYRSVQTIANTGITFSQWLMDDGIKPPTVTDNVTPPRFKKSFIMNDDDKVVPHNFQLKLTL